MRSLCLFFFVSSPCGAPWMFPFPVSFLGTALSVFVSFVWQISPPGSYFFLKYGMRCVILLKFYLFVFLDMCIFAP